MGLNYKLHMAQILTSSIMAAAGRVRFQEYFTQEANPFANIGNLLHQFRADGGIMPAC
jgi:hypothetical protein